MCSSNLHSRCQNLQKWAMQQRSNNLRSQSLPGLSTICWVRREKGECFTWDQSQTQPERTRSANISQMQKLSWFISKWTNKRFRYEQCPDAPEACSVCQFHWPNTHSTLFRFQWQHIMRSIVLSAKDFTNLKPDEQIAKETPLGTLMDWEIRSHWAWSVLIFPRPIHFTQGISIQLWENLSHIIPNQVLVFSGIRNLFREYSKGL